MAETTDIREWARRQGIEIGDRGRIPADIRDAYQAEQAGDDFVARPAGDFEQPPDPTAAGPSQRSSPPRPATTAEDAPSSAAMTAGETPPAPGKKKKPWQRIQIPKDDKPRAAGRRVPLETWIGRAWKGLAYITGAGTTPTSRVLNLQAPVAGIVVDDMIKGTLPDRVLQPLARMGEGGKDVAALVGFPLLVAATERKPELYQWTRPLMVEAATEWVLIAGPAMRKAKARAAKVAEELDAFELQDDDIEGSFARAAENPAITRMLDAIFAPMMQPGPLQEPEPAAV
jgi:hypothetical protein